MRQQLECEVARPGYEAVAVQGSALGDENVRGTSPVSLRPKQTMTIYTICVIHSAVGGWNYLLWTVSERRKRSQVSEWLCGHMHPNAFTPCGFNWHATDGLLPERGFLKDRCPGAISDQNLLLLWPDHNSRHLVVWWIGMELVTESQWDCNMTSTANWTLSAGV